MEQNELDWTGKVLITQITEWDWKSLEWTVMKWNGREWCFMIIKNKSYGLGENWIGLEGREGVRRRADGLFCFIKNKWAGD